jgi:hypothetical protein
MPVSLACLFSGFLKTSKPQGGKQASDDRQCSTDQRADDRCSFGVHGCNRTDLTARRRAVCLGYALVGRTYRRLAILTADQQVRKVRAGSKMAFRTVSETLELSWVAVSLAFENGRVLSPGWKVAS